ncbi:MAG: hypothetical protein U0457_01410 [Candidatus Sericytochromatia bacterium]
MKNNIQKYLTNYAEKEINFSEVITKNYDNVLIIPAYNEYFEIKELLENNLVDLAKENNFLVILVINSKKESILNNNLIDFLGDKKIKNSPNTLISFINYDIFVINRSFENYYFEEKQGVGLARKIGCDIATKLYEEGKIKSNWLRCSDGDVILPKNYFEINPNPKKYSCIVYDFYHDFIPENSSGLSLTLYEIYLRYYLFGLNYANSPYAFYTIGSCMAVEVETYAGVRGFSDSKEAGEDFYMMNKLSKIKNIFDAKESTIRIKYRESDRVPFGTGASITKIRNKIDASYGILNPARSGDGGDAPEPHSTLGLKSEVFNKNKIYLKKEIEEINDDEYKIYDPKCFEELKKLYLFLDKNQFLEKLDENEFFIQALIKLGFLENLEKLKKISIKKNTSNEINYDLVVLKKHINIWFDAFRIMKFIHYLTDNFYPLISWEEAIKKAPFMEILDITSPYELCRKIRLRKN